VFVLPGKPEDYSLAPNKGELTSAGWFSSKDATFKLATTQKAEKFEKVTEPLLKTCLAELGGRSQY